MSSTVFPEAPPYPVNLNLFGKSVLVVGAGYVASRKVPALLESGASVVVVGPLVHDSLAALAHEHRTVGELTIEAREYQTGEVADYVLAITCTDSAAVNTRVHDEGVAAGVWVNSADDPANCEFTLMSIVRQGDLQLTISTGGRSPALSMHLRKVLTNQFDSSWSDLLDLLSTVRDEAKQLYGTSEISGWNDAVEAGLHQLVAQGEHDVAERLLRQHLGLAPKRTLAAVT